MYDPNSKARRLDVCDPGQDVQPSGCTIPIVKRGFLMCCKKLTRRTTIAMSQAMRPIAASWGTTPLSGLYIQRAVQFLWDGTLHIRPLGILHSEGQYISCRLIRFHHHRIWRDDTYQVVSQGFPIIGLCTRWPGILCWLFFRRLADTLLYITRDVSCCKIGNTDCLVLWLLRHRAWYCIIG